MKSDRELLELAARASDIDFYWSSDSAVFGDTERNGDWRIWNPLTIDGDALRLAVKLNILYGKVFARNLAEYHEDGDDIYAATRRSIVLAAASIGESME